MGNEDLNKLDYQQTIIKMLESNTAMLRTVLQNQMEIKRVLYNGDPVGISAEVNKLLQENIAIVDNDLKKQGPETQYIKFPKE